MERIDQRLSAYFFLQVTALLHSDGIWLFSEYFAHFRQIAVPRGFVFYLRRVVNERVFSIFALYHLKDIDAFVSSVFRDLR